MLELGKSGSHGLARGTRPVLDGDVVVATLRASNWKEAATAEVSGRVWQYSKRAGQLTGRWVEDPEHAVRLRARKVSFWRGDWVMDLEGVQVQMTKASLWKGTHRYSAGTRQVAESGNTGGWSRRPTLTAAGELPLSHQVFLLWVEFVFSRRDDGAAAAV